MIVSAFENLGFLGILLTMAMACAITGILAWFLIPLLKKLKAGQSIRTDGPESHLSKEGTPTMGGVAIIAGTVVSFFIVNPPSADVAIMVLVFVAFGVLGFFDDYVKVRLKRSLGLNVVQKLALQIVIAAPAAIYQVNASDFGTAIYVPFARVWWDLGYFYIPFVIFVFIAMVNGVNLTDGLDGLASGVSAEAGIFFAVAGGLNIGNINLLDPGYTADGALFCGALSGACLGFLIHNRKPARVFMGDTGSLALGGGLAASAVLMHLELLLPIVGFIYVAESVSVILQVGSYKLRKKRLFRMAPLHHHFELGGFSEEQVVRSFWGVTLALCLLGIFSLV
ncbi:phospho-N-acetylmuramoyl-pentapeptide-transferase [Clostridia bacterium]|nr:phospho-N-acetylmuramoyl-pentapeptide-transferase [Clostridia bacterium]